MPLYELGADRIEKLPTTTFAEEKIQERGDLQRLFRDQIEILVPDAMVLTEEFGDWQDSSRRIDILAIDKEANLIVLELKRTDDGGHMELQAIRYAAMVSAMTWTQAVDAHREYLQHRGIEDDPQTRLLAFLQWDEPDVDRFAQDVRIVLASADFSKEITTAVLWLNDRGVEIRCLRLVPYRYGEKTLLDVQQVIPLPEAEEYQIRVREKATQERAARQEHGSRAERNLRFWTRLLQKANDVCALHRNVSASKDNWIAATAHGCNFNYVTAHDSARVELYLGRVEAADNKAIYDELHGHKAEIEAKFGGALNWQRLDNKTASRISAEVTGGLPKDETTWDALHDAMVDAMRRLEAALAPHIERYRKGEKPNVAGLQ